MRLLLFIVLLSLIGWGVPTYAQSAGDAGPPFGNEWINPNQQYYKISVGEDGIYQLSYADLQAAGFPVGGVDPRRIQLFFRGQEQAIIVQGQQDARLDPEDFIIFYGQENDGTLDTELYVSPEAPPHPYYNLYSDTTAYFLTWRLDTGTGRRMSAFSENNVTNIPAQPFHLKEAAQRFTSDYSAGRLYPLGSTSGINARLSAFDYGEGWTGTRLKRDESADYTLPVVNPVRSGPNPRLSLVLAGRNGLQHRVTVQVGPNAGSLRTLAEVTFDYYDSYRLDETLEWSDVGNEQFTVRITVNGVGGAADNASLSYVGLTYAQQADAEASDLTVNLPADANGRSYLTVNNPPANPLLLDITDPNAPEQVGVNVIATQLTAVVPNTATARRLYVGGRKAVPMIRRTNLVSPDPSATYLIISHPTLHQPGGSYSDPVAAYQAYRSSPEGGSHATMGVDVQQLYNQFGYGETTPLAIRRFCRYMFAKGQPEYLLIIGKGLLVNFNPYRQDPATTTQIHYVPTAGFPGSDILFTAGLGNSDGVGAGIPTGRINARDAREVANYLDKVKEQEARDITADYQAESTREALWKKRLIHLSGGVTASEQVTFGRYVDDFERVVDNDFLGAQVSTQSKKTNNATELINVSDEVNKGVALITFFGHSSSARTDIEIGSVSNDELGYRNKGKYTAILLNGCNAGNVFSNARTFGEDWISTANRGALHVMAHSSTGLSSVLKRYSDNFYGTVFGDSLWVDQSLGKAKTEAERRFLANTNNPWEAYTAQVQQMVLQGDPAIPLFGRGQPDYEISEKNVFISPLEEGPVTASSDSFAVNLVVRNFGRTGPDSLAVQLSRTLGDGSTVTYGPQYFPPVLYQDTLQFSVSSLENETSADQTSGNNRFEVIIDAANRIAEINEDNNRTTLEFFVPVSGTVNLLPYNYALLSQPTVVLHVQPGNLSAALLRENPREFLVELDTSARFDSPVKQQTSAMATTLLPWSVSLPVVTDSTVYYWRSRYATPQDGELDDWTSSSFTYVGSSPAGWVQRQAAQWEENQVTGLTYTDQWDFEESSLQMEVRAYGSEHAQENPSVLIDGKSFIITNVREQTCRDNSLNGIAFDRNTLQPYLAIKRPGFDVLDKNSCGPLPQVVNTFADSQVSATGLLAQYVDTLNAGDPVVLFSIGQLNYPAWDAATLAKLQDIGVAPAALDSLRTGEPLIILGRKNAPVGTATVVRADTTSGVSVAEQALALDEQITGQFSRGSIVSRRIGPAVAWASLQTQIAAQENDNVTVSLLGESASGQATVLLDELADQPTVDLTDISAEQYPYLRLQFTTADAIDLTPAQLKQWLVIYTGVPEGTLLRTTTDSLVADRPEGEPFTATFNFYNLSSHDFTDSLTVAYAWANEATRTTTMDSLRIAPLSTGDTATFSITTATFGRAGANDLLVNVNPRLLPEQSYQNNQAALRNFFTVVPDKAHPIIDVAFDGRYIADGDIVSPRPLIAVVVRDENPILRKQDTTGIEMYLRRRPSEGDTVGTSFERIRLSGADVEYTPATDEAPFALTFQPELEDGVYTLRVQAEDASGNPSGTQPYQINFEVINASTITYYHPYPNPFTEATRFVFTLTGSVVPDQLAIQIMTVTGQVVREITPEEIGPLRPGSENIQFRWDGHNDAGAPLVTGMYLYRITLRSPDGAIRQRTTSDERVLRQKFGKLYIVR